jgi:hypothetical protein
LSLNHHKHAIGFGEFNLTITIIGDITYTSTYTNLTSWRAPFSILKGNTSTFFDGLKEETVHFSMMYGLPVPSSLTFGFHALGTQDEPFATAWTWEDRYEASDNEAGDNEDRGNGEGVSVALIVGISAGASILVLGCCCHYWYLRQVRTSNTRPPIAFPMTGTANVHEAKEKRPVTSSTSPTAPIDVPSAPSPTIGMSAPHAVSQPSQPMRFCTRCGTPTSPEISFCGECGLPSLAGLEVLQPNY